MVSPAPGIDRSGVVRIGSGPSLPIIGEGTSSGESPV